MAEKTFSPVRVRAATQEAAITQALQMTGATREEVDVEVVEETEKGVTVRVAPLGTLSSREVSAAPANQAESAPAQSPVQEEEPAPSPEPEAQAQEDEAEADEVEEIASADNDEEDEEEEIAPAAEATEVPEVREADPEVVEHARALAQEMLDHMGLEAEVLAGDLPVWCLPTSHDKSERVRDVPRAFLSIEGEDVGILIGKHGQTLQSFQYLLNLSLNNTTEDEEATADGVRAGGVHVVVDAGEYRGRRAVALERAAREAAERAKREQRSIRMEPMPGHERRLVHLALFEDAGVSTSSDGREPWRRVVVTPAGVRPSRGNDDRGGGKRYRGRNDRNERSGGYGDSQRSYGSRAGKTGNGRRGYN
jgi:spoIIIJ-associated protein